MRAVARFLGGLLALALVGWALGSSLDATVYDERYLAQAATSSGLYAGLATALPPVIAAASAGTLNQALLSGLITPQLVEDRLGGVIGGTATAWKSGTEVPRLDVSDLATQLEVLGVTLPPALAGPLGTARALTSPAVNRVAGAIGEAARLAGGLAPAAAAVLTGLIVLVGGRRRWRVLAGAALSAALTVAVLAGLVWILPGPATAGLATSSWSALAEPVRGFVAEAARVLVVRLLWWGGGLAAAAVVVLTVPPVTGRLYVRRHHESEPPDRPASHRRGQAPRQARIDPKLWP